VRPRHDNDVAVALQLVAVMHQPVSAVTLRSRAEARSTALAQFFAGS
jgi:hypothetical protein